MSDRVYWLSIVLLLIFSTVFWLTILALLARWMLKDDDGKERLDQALEVLGYNEIQPAHHRSNLLSAIALFAGVSHDEVLARACEARINCIRTEAEAARYANNGS